MLARSIEAFAQRTITQLIGQTTCLRAHAPIRTTSAHHRGHEALPRIANAERAMCEAFRFHTELRSKMDQVSYLRKRKLTCQCDPLGPQRRFSYERIFRVGVHLR